MDAYYLGFDQHALVDRYDVPQAAERLDQLGPRRDLDALIEKVSLLRITDRLEDAQEAATEALRQARFEGDRRLLAEVKVARALVITQSGRPEQAVADLTDVVTESSAHGWAEVEARALHGRALAHLATHRLDHARDDLSASLVILIRERAPALDIDSTMIAIGALMDRMVAVG